MPRHLAALAALAVIALSSSACGAEADTTAARSAEATSTTVHGAATNGLVIDEARCAANAAAGTITYASPFDVTASTSILEVIVAMDRGYFDQVCLDVEFVPAFAPANSALVAEGTAQMGGAGCFGELVGVNLTGGADLVAVAQFGHTAIAALVVPADAGIDDLATDLPGRLVGIKGDLPCDVKIMLARLGVERGSFDTVLLEGFDPLAHLELGIDALPVYKSNEPRTLDAAGVDYVLYDPLELDIPASFGLLTTSRRFLSEHRSAVEDFVRATLQAHEWAAAHPTEAVDAVIARSDPGGSEAAERFEATERYRWQTESRLVAETTPPDLGVGGIDLSRLGAEVDVLSDIGAYPTPEPPSWRTMVDPSVVEAVTDADGVLW